MNRLDDIFLANDTAELKLQEYKYAVGSPNEAGAWNAYREAQRHYNSLLKIPQRELATFVTLMPEDDDDG